jgi:hypothetical protein
LSYHSEYNFLRWNFTIPNNKTSSPLEKKGCVGNSQVGENDFLFVELAAAPQLVDHIFDFTQFHQFFCTEALIFSS